MSACGGTGLLDPGGLAAGGTGDGSLWCSAAPVTEAVASEREKKRFCG